MSPKFIQALKSLGAQHLTKQHHVQPIIEQQPPIITSSSTTTVAINILQDLLSDIQYTISDIKLSISQTLTLHDKSQSEILFLIAILLTILLFVVILPIYEAITDDEEVNEIRNKIEKEVPSSAPLKMYKPGVGIVEVTYDSPSLLRMSSDTSNSSSGSDRSLNGSICTHHSLETIEESEEEYLQEEESEEVLGLDTTAVDDEEEEEEETVDDKYCEFLSFCNSDD